MFFGKRRQYFVDPKVQGAIVVRCLVYWITCLFSTFVMLFFWSLLTGPARLSWMTIDQIWYSYGPAFIASMLLLPLVLGDILRMTNRFAGPVLRLHRELKKLANGENVNPLFFREGDCWKYVADDFNRVVMRLKEAEGKELVDGRNAVLVTAQAHEQELASC